MHLKPLGASQGSYQGFAVFGRVTKGMDVVRKIHQNYILIMLLGTPWQGGIILLLTVLMRLSFKDYCAGRTCGT